MRALLLLPLLLAACSRPAVVDEAAVCRAAVLDGLVDPASARVEGERFVGETNGKRLYVLTVNSKNRMGGYSGRREMTCTFTAPGRLEGAPVETTRP